MSAIDLVVVGSGPAGHAAAAGYRESGGEGTVVVLSAEGRRPYQRPPLSKELLRGEFELDALPLEDPAFYEDRSIAVWPASATALDPAAHEIALAGGSRLEYVTCVVATGAEPVAPPVPGTDLDGVHLLRRAEQALALRRRATSGSRAVVVGSGFIGCEAAASLRIRGLSVALVSEEAAPQTGRLGPEAGERLDGWLREAGVTPHYETTLTAIERGDDGLVVVLEDGEPLHADLVLLASGVRPVTALAESAGLELAEGGEIPADARMRTAAAGVLACGDCCRAEHALAGRPLHVEHWGDALAQGAIAGATAAGGDATWRDVPGFWSTIGTRTLKYAAWGDGYDSVRLSEGDDGEFTAWYEREGRCVGVLTHQRDEDYEQGRERIAAGGALP
jgi:3-phenylpropionate/trans-cinnamate dioxygenase ferredoxin reductase component